MYDYMIGCLLWHELWDPHTRLSLQWRTVKIKGLLLVLYYIHRSYTHTKQVFMSTCLSGGCNCVSYCSCFMPEDTKYSHIFLRTYMYTYLFRE